VELTVNQWLPLSLSLQSLSPFPVISFRPYQTLLLSYEFEAATSEEDQDASHPPPPLSPSPSPPSPSPSPSSPHDADVTRMDEGPDSGGGVVGGKESRPRSTVSRLLPPDASPSLLRFVERCHPQKSFQDLSVELSLSLPHIFRLAAHLVYWGKGKVADVLKKESVLLLSPSVPVGSGELVAMGAQFRSEFPHIPLPPLLALFSTPHTLGEHLARAEQSVQKRLYGIVLWLLRRDLLTPLHTFFYLTLPDTPMPGGGGGGGEGDGVVWMDDGLSGREMATLRLLDDHSEAFRVLMAIAPYCHGQHHVGEIAWRCGITRADVMNVAKTYQKYVKKCEY
jgi:hypothetical protein